MSKFTPPFLGSAYYPEAWPLEQIDEDVTLMREAGMTVARIGEFAWSRMEPEEGRYELDWMHLVVETLGAANIATVIGTPTCTPPAWLTTRHPEILPVMDDGRRVSHGERHHRCPNVPVYREYSERIVSVLAETMETSSAGRSTTRFTRTGDAAAAATSVTRSSTNVSPSDSTTYPR